MSRIIPTRNTSTNLFVIYLYDIICNSMVVGSLRLIDQLIMIKISAAIIFGRYIAPPDKTELVRIQGVTVSSDLQIIPRPFSRAENALCMTRRGRTERTRADEAIDFLTK